MTFPSSPPSAQDLIDLLTRQRGKVDDGLAESIRQHRGQPRSPLYVLVLTALGASFAWFLVSSTLTALMMPYLEDGPAILVPGLVFIVMAVAIAHSNKSTHAHSASFVVMVGFCVMLTGKGYIISAMGMLWPGPWTIPLGLLALTMMTWVLFPLSLERFLSALATLGAILLVLTEEFRGESWSILVMNGFFVLQLLIGAYLFTRASLNTTWLPLAYALVFSLAGGLVFFAASPAMATWTDFDTPSQALFAPFMIMALIALIGWTTKDWRGLFTMPLLPGVIAIIILGLILSPAILFSMALIVYGYGHHNRILLITGILTLVLFIILYYYNLDLTLLVKSASLVGGGLLLLAGYLYTIRLTKNKRVQS